MSMSIYRPDPLRARRACGKHRFCRSQLLRLPQAMTSLVVWISQRQQPPRVYSVDTIRRNAPGVPQRSLLVRRLHRDLLLLQAVGGSVSSVMVKRASTGRGLRSERRRHRRSRAIKLSSKVLWMKEKESKSKSKSKKASPERQRLWSCSRLETRQILKKP